MANVLKELVQYYGIDNCRYDKLINFKQFSIDEIICLPSDKRDIEQITKVWLEYKIIDFEVLKTPIGTSHENQTLTGKKVFIASDLSVKIEYVTNQCNQTIHSMHKTIPFSSYVTLQEEYNECSLVCPSISIEDIYCEQIGPRSFYINAVLIATADIC